MSGRIITDRPLGLVTRASTENDSDGFIAIITVVRSPYLASVNRPRAIDLPEDIRKGLRAWLDEADKEAER